MGAVAGCAKVVLPAENRGDDDVYLGLIGSNVYSASQFPNGLTVESALSNLYNPFGPTDAKAGSSGKVSAESRKYQCLNMGASRVCGNSGLFVP